MKKKKNVLILLVYSKSKNEKTISNKMLKFIQQTDKDNQKRRLSLN
jgi:hypothetical protein